MLAVYDGSNNLIMRFLYADARMPVAMTAGGATSYLGYDQVGTLRVVTDAAGNIVKRIDYDSFGNIINNTNPAVIIPFGFAGGLHDRDTGLVRFGFRDYDPDIGRFSARDPMRFGGGDTDLYGYVRGNPSTYVDPNGLTWCDISGALRAVKSNYPDLKLPSRVEIKFKKDDKWAGEYELLKDSMNLNERYLDDLSDSQAKDLLNTILEEVLHKDSSLLGQLYDTFIDYHPAISLEAERLTEAISAEFLKERKESPCYFQGR